MFKWLSGTTLVLNVLTICGDWLYIRSRMTAGAQYQLIVALMPTPLFYVYQDHPFNTVWRRTIRHMNTEVEKNRNQWRTDHCKTDYKLNRKNHGVRKYNKVNPLKMEYKRFIRVVLLFKTQFKMRLICLTAGNNVRAMYTGKGFN